MKLELAQILSLVRMQLTGLLRSPASGLSVTLPVLGFWALGAVVPDRRILTGPLAMLLVPLLAAACARACTPGARGDTRAALESWVDSGRSPQLALVAHLSSCTLLLFLAFALALGPSLLLARSASSLAPALVVVALAAPAYACAYTFAGSFRRGSALLVAADLLLLAPDDNWLLPSSHLLALLGASKPEAHAPSAHLLGLVLIALIGFVLSILRVTKAVSTPKLHNP